MKAISLGNGALGGMLQSVLAHLAREAAVTADIVAKREVEAAGARDRAMALMRRMRRR